MRFMMLIKSDAQTEAVGLGKQGKEECWLVIDAEPGATLGIGFNQPLDAATTALKGEPP